jgi:hypothetical protein
MKSVMYIDNDGNVSGLADDNIDRLDDLGQKLVARVSNIEYDHSHQCWVATDLEGGIIASNPVRSRVIEAERAYFNKLIENAFACAVNS